MSRLLSLYNLAVNDNIEVVCFTLPESESLSIVDDRGKCFVAIDPMQLTGMADEAYKLAHELGHCKTGSFYSRYLLYELRERFEWRAEKWAIKKLLPRTELQTYYENAITDPWAIAEETGLPEKFIRKAMEYYHEEELAN